MGKFLVGSMNTVQVMIDLETMSTRSNAAICSIGAVKFTIESGIIGTFYCTIEAQSCKNYGLHFSKETIEWWMRQNKEALKALTTNCIPLEDALTKFKEWYGEKSLFSWRKVGMTSSHHGLYVQGYTRAYRDWETICS